MKRTFVVFLLLIVVAAGLAFYFSWLNVSTSADPSHVNFTLTVNKGKVQVDQEKARRKLERLGEQIKEKTDQGPKKTEDSVLQQKEDFQKEAQAKLDDFSQRIEVLKARARDAGADTRSQMKPVLDDLEIKQEALKDKIDELKAAGADSWKELKSGVDQAAEDLKKAYDRAAARFKD